MNFPLRSLAVILSFICGFQLAHGQKPSTSAAVGDWPVFLGPAGDGIVRNAKWNPQLPSSPKQLWTAELGTGFSSFSVNGNRVVSMGHDGGKDYVWCLDLNTGKTLWSQNYPCALVDNLHEGGPAGTPCIDGDKVYTLSKEGQLGCFDMKTGKPAWGVELQKTLDVQMPAWGFSCSPRVLGNMLLLEAGHTVAINKLTGKGIWSSDKFRMGYGSVTVFDNGKKLAALNNDMLMVLEAATGKELAKHRWETNHATSACTPVIVGDNKLFVSTGYGQGCALFEFTGSDLKMVYQNKKLRAHMATPIVIGDYVYGIDGQSNERSRCRLVCLELATGEEKWSQRGVGCGTLLAADDKLIVFTDEGTLITAEVNGEKYQEISKATILDGRCWTVPVLAQGKILARNATGKAVCVDVSK
jgi:outer membrane protein assembly factor BamB